MTPFENTGQGALLILLTLFKQDILHYFGDIMTVKFSTIAKGFEVQERFQLGKCFLNDDSPKNNEPTRISITIGDYAEQTSNPSAINGSIQFCVDAPVS